MTLNKEFTIVFQPKDREIYNGKRRFAVGAYSLEKYVGKKNAEVAIQRATDCLEDKIRIRLRKHGIIDFYVR